MRRRASSTPQGQNLQGGGKLPPSRAMGANHREVQDTRAPEGRRRYASASDTPSSHSRRIGAQPERAPWGVARGGVAVRSGTSPGRKVVTSRGRLGVPSRILSDVDSPAITPPRAWMSRCICAPNPATRSVSRSGCARRRQADWGGCTPCVSRTRRRKPPNARVEPRARPPCFWPAG